MSRKLFAAGSLLALLAVAAGAFGAHALRARLTPDMLDVFQTAARYQMYHALALIGAAWAANEWPGRAVTWAGRLFVLGIVLFSGSLYLLAFTGMRWLGVLTPIGGVAFLAGWAALMLAPYRAAT